MKYSEFEELIKGKGFDVENNRYEILVCDDGSIVSSVSKIKTLVMSTNYTSFMVLDDGLRIFVGQKCMELAFTNLEDREEEEVLYYLRQIGVGSWNFLNFNINSQEYNVAGKKDDFTYKTQFTQLEIDDMPECYTHPAVWEKIKVDREWSEMD